MRPGFGQQRRRFIIDFMASADIGSLRSYTDGVRTGDQAKLISAATTYNSFSEWMSTHAKELRFP